VKHIEVRHGIKNKDVCPRPDQDGKANPLNDFCARITCPTLFVLQFWEPMRSCCSVLSLWCKSAIRCWQNVEITAAQPWEGQVNWKRSNHSESRDYFGRRDDVVDRVSVCRMQPTRRDGPPWDGFAVANLGSRRFEHDG